MPSEDKTTEWLAGYEAARAQAAAKANRYKQDFHRFPLGQAAPALGALADWIEKMEPES